MAPTVLSGAPPQDAHMGGTAIQGRAAMLT
jgi:hypothetical protein